MSKPEKIEFHTPFLCDIIKNYGVMTADDVAAWRGQFYEANEKDYKMLRQQTKRWPPIIRIPVAILRYFWPTIIMMVVAQFMAAGSTIFALCPYSILQGVCLLALAGRIWTLFCVQAFINWEDKAVGNG